MITKDFLIKALEDWIALLKDGKTIGVVMKEIFLLAARMSVEKVETDETSI